MFVNELFRLLHHWDDSRLHVVCLVEFESAVKVQVIRAVTIVHLQLVLGVIDSCEVIGHHSGNSRVLLSVVLRV